MDMKCDNLRTFNPTKYTKSKFVKHPSKRVWLAADGIARTAAAQRSMKMDRIGTIPLRDKPPPGTGENTWNGICFAMV